MNRLPEDDTYHIHHLSDDRLELIGGGDFYSEPEQEIDEETRQEAQRLADKYGMEITNSYGQWEGWSEYTPDPGDVSVFYWRKKNA